jgi:hypothetical protein
MSAADHARHPVRLVVTDDLHRSRLTVFFRLLLALPHLIWAWLLGIVVFLCVLANWFILLVRAETPRGLHDFIAGYIRYIAHLYAYVLLAANSYPPFFLLGDTTYAVDVEIDPPAPQNRWKTFFRLFLAIPAWLIATAVVGGGGGRNWGGAAFAAAFLLWFVGVIQARATRGLRDLIAYGIGYSAQVAAYALLLTDRYPYSGPNAFATAREVEQEHPVGVTVTDDLRRSRLLVFFRLPIAIPHLVWAILWSLVAIVVGLLNWIWAVVTGRPVDAFHRFLSRYLRYTTHLAAFLFMVGNPFPGFTGKPGTYPVDLELPGPEPQRRLVTLFRLVLAIPALIVACALAGALWVAGILGWFVGLFLGRMPDGVRNLGAYALRYGAQVNAYLYLVTPRYPDAAPRPDPASP